MISPISANGSIVTPVMVRHQLCFEVLFSVYGQDVSGVPLRKPGPGEVRRMKVFRDVEIAPVCHVVIARIGG